MRIGIVSPWYERGIAFISLAMWQALAPAHYVYVLAKPGRRGYGDEWDVPNLTYGPADQFKFPLDWATDNELEALIFNERLDCRQLAPLREEHGIKTLGLLEWEFVRPDDKTAYWLNRCYDAIIAPQRHAYERFRSIGIKRVYHVPWGVDLGLFKPPVQPRTGPVRFFQPANYGGMHGRKNVRATRQAWARAKRDGAELDVHLQREEILTHAQMADRMRAADVALLPSKWEGLGLTFMEALASGLALVTVDAPPMNDYVEDGYNGYVCKATTKGPPPGVFIDQALVDLDDYQAKITALARDPETTRQMGRRSRQMAEQRFDWSVNGKRLVQAVNEACGV